MKQGGAHLSVTVSGLVGASLFFCIHFTSWFAENGLFAGLLQILINGWVFYAWFKLGRGAVGMMRVVSFFGMGVPLTLGSITLLRVIVPVIVLI